MYSILSLIHIFYWLFLQSLSLYIVYLSFQTLFFERFLEQQYTDSSCISDKVDGGNEESHISFNPKNTKRLPRFLYYNFDLIDIYITLKYFQRL